MAIDTKQFEATKHTGIKRDKKNHHRFMLVYVIDKKRRRELFTTEAYLGRRDSLNAAYNRRESLISNKKDAIITGKDLDAKVDTYFEDFVRKILNDVTHRNYRTVYKNHIQPHIGNTEVKKVTPDDIENVLFIMRKKEMSVSMVRRVWMTMKFIFELAVEKRIIAESPVLEKHRVQRDTDSEKKVVLNPIQQYKDVHASILKVFADHPKDKALFLLGFMGRRKTEALYMKWEHVDFDTQKYLIPKEMSKIKTDLEFDFNDELRDALLAIKGDRTTGRIFDRNVGTVTQQALKIRKDTGIEQFTFHYMRNILVSAMAEQMTVPQLSAMLGHKDTATLNQYLSLNRASASKKALDASKNLLG